MPAAKPNAKSRARKKPGPPQWNAERRILFLETLALTPNVAAAERAAEMPPGSAYRERRRLPSFNTAWADALADGYSRLEMMLLERALTGVSKRTTKTEAGTVVEEYSDRLGMALLTAHRATVVARRGGVSIDAETAKQRLARRIEEMSRRLGDAAGA